MVEHYVSAELRRLVEQRAKGCCEYCHSQQRYSAQSFSIEHIIPKQMGGESITENLALACQGCNNHKATKTVVIDPGSGLSVRLFHPRQDSWPEHFSWNADYTLLIGIIPIGRATIEALKLNRLGVINLRRVLYKVGEHPIEESDQ
jgi:hypothetical protein